jgi:hypothetical protein
MDASNDSSSIKYRSSSEMVPFRPGRIQNNSRRGASDEQIKFTLK